jgi:hypothetical protein
MTRQADIIKIAAVITATPRWVGALLAAEGIAIPDEWMTLWVPASALLSAAMAIVEGWAFAYVFNAWRNQTDKRAKRLLWLAILSAAVFVFVLAPYIAAQVRGVRLSEVVGSGPVLWTWSAAVAASTITIVASVGYAQREVRVQQPARKPEPVTEPGTQEPVITMQEPLPPVATINNWRAICAQTNGDLHGINAADVKKRLEEEGFAPPSLRTQYNWAKWTRDDADAREDAGR